MTSSNQAQIDYWNADVGRRWTDSQERLDALIGPMGHAALRAASAVPGERVIDIGCGCGDTALALASAVGPSGSVLGVDVSAPMLARARERVAAAGLANVSFVQADAAAGGLPGDRDLLFSRFGVMFFADPQAAFLALRRALRSGGRIAFVCWRAFAENPWAFVPAMAGIQALGVTPPQTDPHAPGPFAFADADRVRAILAAAGFAQIGVEAFEAPMRMGDSLEAAANLSLEIGPLARLIADAGADRSRVAGAVAAALSAHRGADGSVALPGRVWIVTARNP